MRQYTLDTNVFRHETSKYANPDLRWAAKAFWKHVLHEIGDGDAVLLVPKEVIRELEVQSFTLSDKENSKISLLLEYCQDNLPDRVTIEIEHQIRMMSAYVRSNFKQEISIDKMEYGGVSDARILYAAYDEDSILVTANVKDFLLYPLLFPQNEQRLYDMKENVFVTIPKDGYDKIHADLVFKGLLNDFFQIDQQ
ncbi:DUF4411 family protein [Sporosarcina saromensis]|uniref:DUF4411 family protein n=1 Tax=Sporosarcina saromensis TaxID=359365 RepID=A0ABU4GBT9_9BACL|nr:DUF4411 family protein [Sporosarcina saromensis]MDW0114371.1 DUF4411 family protein [Sporosarcina saromensis]